MIITAEEAVRPGGHVLRRHHRDRPRRFSSEGSAVPEFKVLGLLEVVDDRGPIELRAGKIRALLAVLLVRYGRRRLPGRTAASEPHGAGESPSTGTETA